MTSSFVIQQLQATGNQAGGWSYSLPGSSLGGMEDSYIKLQGNCHPDFATVPIGKPTGVKMCVRKPLIGANAQGCKSTDRIGDPLHAKAKHLKETSQGYHRGSVNLYNPKADFPTQEWNPQYYADRRTPWEQDLLRKDYQRWPMKYSGTGINTLRAPAQGRDTNKPYFQYGYSYTPEEDYDTGMRVGTQLDQSRPEYKYDVTRLHQPYTVWKDEQEWVGAKGPDNIGVNKVDTTYYQRVV